MKSIAIDYFSLILELPVDEQVKRLEQLQSKWNEVSKKEISVEDFESWVHNEWNLLRDRLYGHSSDEIRKIDERENTKFEEYDNLKRKGEKFRKDLYRT